VIVGTAHVERVWAFEAEHNPILIVHANSVKPSQITAEGVQPVPGRHSQILEARDGVELIKSATHDWPEFARNPPSRPTVGAVPDVPRRVICESPDHLIAL
jgi:hypothetical protein